MIAKDFSAILLAAGNGRRMQVSENKNFLEVCGRPLLSYTLEAFLCAGISEIILVTRPCDINRCLEIISEVEPRQDVITDSENIKTGKSDGDSGVISESFDPVDVQIITGGATRADSVFAGLSKVTKPYVLIHDAARAFVTKDIIDRCMDCAVKYDACVAAMPLKDTVKIQAPEGAEGPQKSPDNPKSPAESNGSENKAGIGNPPVISDTPDRRLLWGAQTPQTFKTELIRAAYEKAYEQQIIESLTDDAQTVESLGIPVYLVKGDYTNIKVTEASDLILAEAILRVR